MEESAAFGIKTYSNYTYAFCLYPETMRDLKMAQDRLPDFQRIVRSFSGSLKILKSHLHRGFMTLQYIQMIPVDKMPDFAVTAALWVPVQSYYAVHGFGLAAIASLYGTSRLPELHASFLSSAGEKLVKNLLPDPFSARITGGYQVGSFMDPAVEGLNGDYETDMPPGNLETPILSTRIPHIVRCLNTTREREINKKFNLQRKEKLRLERRDNPKLKLTRKNLNTEEKRKIATRVKGTTVFNYFYRTRLRSNYDDPEIFNFGTEDKHLALNFVTDHREMTNRICRLLLRIIERRLKEEDYRQLLEACQGGVKWEA